MNKVNVFVITLCLLSSLAWSQEIRDVEAQEAFVMLKKPATYLVDVRTIAEYVYVGHAEMVTNVPLLFWEEREQDRVANTDFVSDVKSLFQSDDTLILICRSGGRSVTAAKLLKRAGFTNLFNVKQGFEGGRDEYGHRSINGWKNSGLPYTYRLDPKLTYTFRQEQKISRPSFSSLRMLTYLCFTV